jgi:Ca2+-binding RTX toxin-like protein
MALGYFGTFDRGAAARLSGTIPGTPGDDLLVGTKDHDVFQLEAGGSDRVSGRRGNDTFSFGDSFGPGDRVDGGKGADLLQLWGDYADGVALTRKNVIDVEVVQLGGPAGGTFRLSATGDLFSGEFPGELTVVAEDGYAGALDIDAQGLAVLRFTAAGAAGADVFRGSAATNVFSGGGGDDVLVGGISDDYFTGGIGSDTLTGGSGSDWYTYQAADRGPRYGVDTITDFDDEIDIINLFDFGIGFHLAGDGDHVGEIRVGYDAREDFTTLRISTDADAASELSIVLLGDHREIALTSFVW